MKAKTICTSVFAIVLLVAGRALAQEIVATPDPVGGTKIDARVARPTAPNATGGSTDDWRYRQFEGRWWYWTPQNRWLWYSDDGRWVPFDANPSATGGRSQR